MSDHPVRWIIALMIVAALGLYASYRHTNPDAPTFRQLYTGLRDAAAWSRTHGRKGQK